MGSPLWAESVDETAVLAALQGDVHPKQTVLLLACPLSRPSSRATEISEEVALLWERPPACVEQGCL